MCDIIDLIRADYLHIMRWAAKLGELSRRYGEEYRPALVSTWLTLASMIDLHMRADDEICGPAVLGPRHGAGLWPGRPKTITTTSAR